MGALLALAAVGCGSSQSGGSATVPAPPAGSGRVVHGSFHAPAIRGTEHYTAYLPPGYDTGRRRYPVIYALHGLPSTARGYLSMPVARWGAIAERAGEPAIVVAPQGARAGDTDPEWHDWGPGRDWESVVAVDVVDHIDRTYRTLADRRGRALVGISAGGYGATLIAVHHPAVFSVIQSWSGYFHPTNPSGSAPLDVGSPQGNAQASAHTYVPQVRRIYRDFRPTYFSFYVGDADPHFLAENLQLNRELDAADIAHGFAVYRGAHEVAFWNRHEAGWITVAAEQLAP